MILFIIYFSLNKREHIDAVTHDVQADEDPLIQVLPSTGTTISVSFYDTAVPKLGSQHDIIKALLGVCPRERKGSYTAATVDLMNATGMPAAQVSQSLTGCVASGHDAELLLIGLLWQLGW